MKKLILTVSLLLISACMEHDLSYLSSAFDAEHSLAIPLIHSKTILVDLLPEEDDMSSDPDGFLRATFRRDSIAEIKVDSLLIFKDQTAFLDSFSIGEIYIPNFSKVKFTYLDNISSNFQNDLSQQISAAIIDSQNNDSAYFPPIPIQSGGIHQYPNVTEEFLHVLISEGVLSLEITNNLPVELSILELELRNTFDDSLLGSFDFQDISPSETVESSVDIEGLLVSNDLYIEIIYMESPGSGNEWVFVSSDDNLFFSINGLGLIASEGLVKYPSQLGPDSVLVFDLDFDDGVEVDFVELSAGELTYTFDSDINTSIEVTIQIPELLDQDNEVFSDVISINNSGSVVNTILLENYKLDLSTSTNQLHFIYSSQITNSETFVEYNKLDQMSVNLQMVNLEYDLIQGYFGQFEKLIEEDVLDLDLSMFSDLPSGIIFESPSLIFTSDNSFGVPFHLDLEIIGTSESDVVNLYGPIVDVASQDESITVFDVTNSQISEFISINPPVVIYGGSIISNPLGNTGIQNVLSPNSSIVLGFEMDLPMHLRIDNATSKDTLALDIDSAVSSDIDMIESVELHLRTKNDFPFDIALSLFLQDSISGLILDSLNFDVLQAATVDVNGKTIEPIVYETVIKLTTNLIDAFFNSNQAVFDVRCNSFDNQNTAIKLYTDYELIVDAGVIIDTKFEE